jgi:hypothetical protein
MAAVRRLAYEGLLSSELAAGIHRVKGVRERGARLGNWLTAGEAAALWQAPDRQTLTGMRNRATGWPLWPPTIHPRHVTRSAHGTRASTISYGLGPRQGSRS